MNDDELRDELGMAQRGRDGDARAERDAADDRACDPEVRRERRDVIRQSMPAQRSRIVRLAATSDMGVINRAGMPDAHSRTDC